MSSGFTLTRPFHVHRGQSGRRAIRTGEAPSTPPVSRVPRVARLLALAIHFDQLLRAGVVADQAELARLGHVTRARLTQIMNLFNLAPDIQEFLLHLQPTERGREAISERQLRPIVAEPDWQKQRQMWVEPRRR